MKGIAQITKVRFNCITCGQQEAKTKGKNCWKCRQNIKNVKAAERWHRLQMELKKKYPSAYKTT